MPILIVKDSENGAVDVYRATEEQIDSFNTSEILPVSVMGWPIYSPDDLAESSLYVDDLVRLCRQANPQFQPEADTTKRQLANIVFGSIERCSQPFDLTGADEKFYPPPADAAKQAKPRKRRNTDATRREPGDTLKQCGEGTKQALLVDVFKDWATCEQAAEVVGWKASSIRSGLDYDLCTLKGYGWEKRTKDGVDEYRLLYPKGFTEPLPHKKKGK